MDRLFLSTSLSCLHTSSLFGLLNSANSLPPSLVEFGFLISHIVDTSGAPIGTLLNIFLKRLYINVDYLSKVYHSVLRRIISENLIKIGS